MQARKVTASQADPLAEQADDDLTEGAAQGGETPTLETDQALALTSTVTRKWMQRIEAILAQPADYLVDLSIGDMAVSYPAEIKQHRTIDLVTGGEEVARAFLVHRLVNVLGYRPASLELERHYTVGRSGRSQQFDKRIDVILNRDNGDGDAFYFIEAKSPDKFEADKPQIKTQLFALAAVHRSLTGKAPAFLVYYTVEFVGDEPRDKCIIIDHSRFTTYDEWLKADRPTVANELSAGFARPRKVPFVRGGKGGRDLAPNFSARDLDAMATNLHNVLWGGGSVGDTEVFNSLVNLILAKIQDEEDRKEGEEYRFQILSTDEGPDLQSKVMARVNELYHAALKAKLGRTDETKLPDVVQPTKFHPSKLVYTVQTLEGLSFTAGRGAIDGKDIIGGFFERIQRDGFRQTKGQFFTPATVVRFMLYALDLDRLALTLLNEKKRLPYVIDPSCGSATFLIEAMQMVTRELTGRQKHLVSTSTNVQREYNRAFGVAQHEHVWARERLYGVEHNFDLATASKVNMILHGDGSANVFHGDGLKPFEDYVRSGDECPDNILQVSRRVSAYARPVNEKFDVVVSNPPFSVDLDDDTKHTLENGFLFSTKRKSENLFIERYWQLLAQGGRLAVVLPENVFDTGENRYIRLFLFKHFRINAVVSLPALTFEPYTQTKTSLLFATKKPHADVALWDEKWKRETLVYGRLRTKVENYVKVLMEDREWDDFPSIKDDSPDEMRRNIEILIERDLTVQERQLEDAELVHGLKDEIERASALDDDAPGTVNRINSEWVFRRIAPRLSYTFAVHEAQSVGYKRSKVRERPRPNDLFDVEMAPSRIDLTEIRQVFQADLDSLSRSLTQLERRLERLRCPADRNGGSRPPGGVRAEQDAEAERLERVADVRREQIEKLAEEQERTETALNRFYDFPEMGRDGALRAEFTERTDDDLLNLFQTSRLAPWRSSAVVLRDTKRRTGLPP